VRQEACKLFNMTSLCYEATTALIRMLMPQS
jgi:hypothetical protein